MVRYDEASRRSFMKWWFTSQYHDAHELLLEQGEYMSGSRYTISVPATQRHSRFAQALPMIGIGSKRTAMRFEHIAESGSEPRRGREDMALKIHEKIVKNFTRACICWNYRKFRWRVSSQLECSTLNAPTAQHIPCSACSRVLECSVLAKQGSLGCHPRHTTVGLTHPWPNFFPEVWLETSGPASPIPKRQRWPTS